MKRNWLNLNRCGLWNESWPLIVRYFERKEWRFYSVYDRDFMSLMMRLKILVLRSKHITGLFVTCNCTYNSRSKILITYAGRTRMIQIFLDREISSRSKNSLPGKWSWHSKWRILENTVSQRNFALWAIFRERQRK